jgi:hypothetical protein
LVVSSVDVGELSVLDGAAPSPPTGAAAPVGAVAALAGAAAAPGAVVAGDVVVVELSGFRRDSSIWFIQSVLLAEF